MAVNKEQWAEALLGRLGIRPSRGGVRALVGWANAEGGHWSNSARFNPLNTTLRLPGSSVMNGGNVAGVQAYRNWHQGLRATAMTLRHYPGVLQALRAGNPGGVAQAVGSSPWGTSAGLVRSAISSAHVGRLGPVPGALTGSGGSGGGAGLLAGSGAAQVPQGSTGILDLVQQLTQQAARPQSTGLRAPSFAAGPVTPQGYKIPAASGGGATKTDVSALLDAIRTTGGDVPGGAGGALGIGAGGAGGMGGMGGGGPQGRVTVAPGANRAGVPLQKDVIQFVRKVAGLTGRPLTINYGSNHSRLTINGTVSDHWRGQAADVDLTGKALIHAGQAALIAAGMDPQKARRITGGGFNVGGWQVIFNTDAPGWGNHLTHLHVGRRG